VVPVSFPDVIGAFAPTVRSTFVNAVSALRVTEDISSTQLNANKPIYSSSTFQFCPMNSLHKHSKIKQ
jgi:hypothetical protein